MCELENRLKKHAEVTKSVMSSPFDFEREEFIMTNKKHKVKKSLLLAAAIACLVGTTVFAAFGLLNARDVANNLGDTRLAEYFAEQKTVSVSARDGEYKATVLGVVSGENLSKFTSSAWELFAERTYVAVAVERIDGKPMTFDDEILITPLIEGLDPMKYNIFTMNGGYFADISDGVLYRIIEFDSVEYFADKPVYIAVLSEAFMNRNAYSYESETGKISANENYDGTNMLIELQLDKSKANPEKALEYLEKLGETVKISE